MLVYEKKVEGERHLFGTMGNVPSDDDVQLTYKDAEGSTAEPTLQDTFLDDGHGGIVMVHDESGTITESELNVFIGDTQIIPPATEEETEYTITLSYDSEEGTVTSEPADKAKAGDEVTISVSGGEADTITVKDADDQDVAFADDKFTMPASNVTVTVTFK